MRVRSVAMLLAAGLALAGCARSQTGSIYDPAAKTPQIVSAALADLAQRPGLEFSGTVEVFNDETRTADLTTQVLSNGLSYGVARHDGEDVELMNVDGGYFAKASKEFWLSQITTEYVAAKSDDTWTMAYPEYWYDPSRLTAEAYAQALQTELTDSGAMSTALPEPVDVDGVLVFPLPVRDNGIVYISAVEPYSVTQVSQVAIDVVGWRNPFDVTILDQEQVAELGDKLTEAVADMSTMYDNFASVFVTDDDEDYDCKNTVCDFSVKVSVDELIGYGTRHDTIRLILDVTMDAGSVGTETCQDTADVALEGSATLSCKATFDPPAGASYDVYFDSQVTGTASYTPDTDAITKNLEADLAQVGKEFS